MKTLYKGKTHGDEDASEFFVFQSTKTVLSCMKLLSETAVFIPSTLTMLEPFKYTVTKQQPVEGGLCSKRDWTDRLISTVAGMITNTVSEI